MIELKNLTYHESLIIYVLYCLHMTDEYASFRDRRSYSFRFISYI